MKNAMKMTGTQIEMKAQELGMKVKTVIPGVFSEVEYLVVEIKFGKSAWFLMDNNTFKYSYSHTYNAVNDKTTNAKPKGF
jgi:hypothetical protein